jgi:hypothetical protein
MFNLFPTVLLFATLAVNIGTARMTRSALADGKPLAAGTYQLQLTGDGPKPAIGQTAASEQWVEFARGGTVVGRELASVFSDAEIAEHVKGPRPKANTTRVDALKGGDYLRVWVNKSGTNYLINLRTAK